MERAIKVHFPKWAVLLYGGLALVLVPWILDLAANLPVRHVARHWDTLWVGFDIMMLITILLTLWFMLKKMVWIVVSASALATLFIVDAWFDILTARPGMEEREAIVFGILEVTLSMLTFRLVYLTVHRATTPGSISFTTDEQK